MVEMADDQQLFLIEFLVDRVQIPVIRAMHDELLPACTCVSFQILSLPPIDICQDALTDGCGCSEGDTQIFKKGKSCLFALPSIVLQRPLTTFPIKMSVFKKLPPGVLPDVMLVGCYQIEAKAIINAVLSQQVFKIPNPCQTIKDTFKITTATGQCVGCVTVYIRASCFGKKIITQFQIPHNRKPYLFKGIDDSPVFQCKKIPSECYVPTPLKCTCKKKCIDGSGESGRTCCPTPIVQTGSCPPLPPKPKPEYGPRPCCPSHQQPSSG
ncbi:microtubule-associated protein 10-like [Ceratina calcarata]|uniref:Microtubule-associated protein 10-like n=1 Tax=Ceratina calcarata TaxID=156304 RepID=A0AAJ7S833_9HYME|nr:microtubule-associated protein 10-like [Ceratina calcarata]